MLRLAGAELIEVPAVPYKDPNNYVKYSGPPRRGACRDGAARRDLGQPVRQCRQPPGPYRDDGGRDLGQTARQGRRLHLRGRHRRHARRRLDGAEGEEQGHHHRHRRSDGRRALQLLQARRAQGGRQLDHRRHRPGPHHRQSRRRRDRRGLSDPRRGGAAGRVQPAQRGRAVPWRIERHQCRRRHPARPRHGPRPYDRHGPCRLRHPLPKSGCSTRHSCARRGCRFPPGSIDREAAAPAVFV